MPGGAGQALLIQVAFLSLLGLSAAVDVRMRRVPNGLSAGVAVMGLSVQLVNRGLLAALSGLAAGVVVIALLWIPWSAGGIGGGDVKLAAAAATAFGLFGLPQFALLTALCGGLVALVAYAVSAGPLRRAIRTNLVAALILRAWPSPDESRPTRASVPYAVAIATGALLTVLYPEMIAP